MRIFPSVKKKKVSGVKKRVENWMQAWASLKSREYRRILLLEGITDNTEGA